MNVLNQTHFDCGNRWVHNKTKNAWANGPEIAAARARGVKAKDLQEAFGICNVTLRKIIKAQEVAPAPSQTPSERETELQGHIDAMRKERATMVRKHADALAAAAEKQAAADEIIAEKDRRIEVGRDIRKDALRRRRKAEAELEDQQKAKYKLEADYSEALDKIEALQREIQVLKGMNESTFNWQKECQDEYQRRVEAEADRKAAEAQIEMMAERLSEIRNRGFWARVFS